jgi:sugar/nucleoside kinase (ribokinase family)
MKFDIVGIGYACVDHLGLAPRIPGVDEAVRVDAWDVQGGGVVAQALVAASRLGAATAYIGNLGDDETGHYLQQDLRREGIDVSLLSLEPGRRSPASFIAVERASGQRTIYAYPGSMSPVALGDAARRTIASGRFLHLDATHIATAVAAARIARDVGVSVSLDACVIEPVTEKNRELIGLTDILVANETFPTQLTGLASIDDACLHLGRLGPRLVIATLGRHGSVLVTEGRIARFGAFPVEVVDTTGAGDVFHGAFLVALGRGDDPAAAIRFASAAAALNCRTFGGRAGIPRRAQVEEFLRTQAPL